MEYRSHAFTNLWFSRQDGWDGTLCRLWRRVTGDDVALWLYTAESSETLLFLARPLISPITIRFVERSRSSAFVMPRACPSDVNPSFFMMLHKRRLLAARSCVCGVCSEGKVMLDDALKPTIHL